jgi:hypothetical protein
MSIADMNIPYVQVNSSLELLQLKNVMTQDPEVRFRMLGSKVETLVIDTIDEVQRMFIRERLKETKKETMSLPDWGWLGEQMTAVLTGFRNLEMNVVFTCHGKETRDDEKGKVSIKPGLQGAISDQIAGYVDLSLLLKTRLTTVIVNGETQRKLERVLQTYPDSNHDWVGDRSGKLPMEVPVNFEDDYARMAEYIFGGVSFPAEKPAVVVDDTKAGEISDGIVEMLPVPTLPTVDDPPAGSRFTADCPKGNPSCEISDDQADLSRIRFRKVLCKECFTDAKNG